MSTDVILLAAGQGTRMRSKRAKVLHELGGKAMLNHVLEAAQHVQPRHCVVIVGHQQAEVQGALSDQSRVKWVTQAEQLGTGHAVKLGQAELPQDGVTLVLYGDVPLVNPKTLVTCVSAAEAGHLALVTAHLEDPAELGRIIRDGSGAVTQIVEHRDATEQQKEIQEINSGIMAIPQSRAGTWLQALTTDNQQGEYLLTDLIAMAVAEGTSVRAISADSVDEVAGVNDRSQLAALERVFQRQQAEQLMQAGVTIADPSRLDIRGKVDASEDVFIDVGVIFEGDVTLGAGVQIGSYATIKDSVLADGVVVHSHTVVDGAIVGAGANLGPFARIRPGSEFADGVKVGNFVETKKARLGSNSKASHLAYLGDAEIGAETNIGAGTVTCNYDGINKHRTTIGDAAFVGTNSTLVAPLEIGDGAFVAAGSTVTTDIPNEQLAVGRARQRNIIGWTPPTKRNS